MHAHTVLLAVALGVPASAAQAQPGSVLVTGPANNANCAPFACVLTPPATRYQQVYAAAAFGGPLDIRAIAFPVSDLAPPGSLNTGTFALYFSTTQVAVDGLDTSNFDANLGTTPQLFGAYTLSSLGGLQTTALRFVGAAYHYDPGDGNLLLDVRATSLIQDPGQFARQSAFFVSRGDLLLGGPPGGNYSRAQDFAFGNAGYGLDTRFSSTVPEPGTVVLLLGGLAGVAAVAYHRARRVG